MTTDKDGFRHDLMRWVETDNSFQGAVVRTQVLNRPRNGDSALIGERLDEIFGEQKLGGYLGDAEDPVTGTTIILLDCIVFGALGSRPEVELAVELILNHPEGDQGFGAISPYAIEALCRMGWPADVVLKNSLRRWLAIEDQWNDPSKLCPWTPAVNLRALWCARDLMPVVPVVERGLTRILDNLDETGHIGYNDPWGFVDCAGVIDRPLARDIILKQMPLLVSSQCEDGGWEENSFVTFRALHTHGFLGPKG